MFIRNVTEALPTNDVHRHAADGVERPANRSRMSAVFLICHVSHPTPSARSASHIPAPERSALRHRLPPTIFTTGEIRP